MPIAPRRLNAVAAMVVLGTSIAYVAALAGGLAWRHSADQPVGEPWFSAMELCILAMMPALVVLFASIHSGAPERCRPLSLAALAFVAMAATLTCALHFTILTLGRTERYAAMLAEGGLLDFRWPSLAYAIDILAWDVFIALGALCAAPSFGGDRLGIATRWALVMAGVLSLAGLLGVPTGDMGLRNIGVVGYAIVLPFAVGLMALSPRREGRS